MKDQHILNMSIEEFDKLAKYQIVFCPDLLKCRDEEEIIDDFYEFYGRKRHNNVSK